MLSSGFLLRKRATFSIAVRRRFNVYANTGKGFLPNLFSYIREKRASLRGSRGKSKAERISAVLPVIREKTQSMYYSASDFLDGVLDRRSRRLYPILMLGVFTASIIFAMTFSVGLRVYYNGKFIGCVKNREDFDSVLISSEKRISDYTGEPYNLTFPVEYRVSAFTAGEELDKASAEKVIMSSVDYLGSKNCCELVIDGASVGFCESSEALEAMLFRIACEQSGTSGETKTTFVQNVQIRPSHAEKEAISDLSVLAKTLRGEKSGVLTYTVRPGDTAGAIGSMYGVSSAEIKALNPCINIDRIRDGQTLVVSDRVPYLTTRTVKQKTYTESVAFDTIIEYSDSLYVGSSKITRAGRKGTAEVTADIEYQNGKEAGRTVISYKIIEAPVSQIKTVGRKKLPPKAATGKFILPTTGRLTSKTGYRPKFHDTHTGIDLANSKGTKVWAADGGKVIFAGWKGNYGYCVIIDHGNGYTTLYAHNSKLLVKVGQKVAQRENIALMGSTGKSTGPHCHFEIRYNGKWKNPLNYVKY